MLNNKKFDQLVDKPGTIGIFDSGMGGLTVANAIRSMLPKQPLLYIGDTAHCPWGDKSSSQINFYSNKLTKFLIEHNCKIIVIACNTASCIAFNELEEKFSQIKLFNVIEPIITYLEQLDLNNFNSIGIIGTKQTVHSEEYQKRIKDLQIKSLINSKLNIKALATPLLVPLIEEGLLEHPATNLLIEQYLANLDLEDNSILILGCTHYPLIKKNIQNYYEKLGKKIIIIDSTILITKQIKNFLAINQSLNNHNYNDQTFSDNEFYCTEDSGFFIEIAQRFFPDIKLKFLPLWE